MVTLADRIMKAKQANAAADTSALEREIDERVYRLYGLTPDEIRARLAPFCLEAMPPPVVAPAEKPATRPTPQRAAWDRQRLLRVMR